MSDLLLYNAKLNLPEGRVVSGALRIAGDRIAEVIEGVSSRDSAGKTPEPGGGPTGKTVNPGTGRAIDLGGDVVLPGFVDTHFHLTSLALKAQRCDLSHTTNAGDVVATLESWAATHDGSSVVGVEWDDATWAPGTPIPTRQQLDGVDGTRPVLARRICGHVGVANTILLQELDVDTALIDRDSGLLREHALWTANGLVAPSPQALSDGIETAVAQLHALGVTAIHDIVEPSRFEAYLAGLRVSTLPLRIDVLLHAHPSGLDHFEEAASDFDPAYFRIAGVKTFLDGSLGGETAALNEPYEGSTGRGTLLLTDDELRSITTGAFERDRMCAIHAIGDRAIDQALTAIERFPADGGRFRIEHCELVGDTQLRRLERCRPILALQPNFIGNWAKRGGLYEARLGPARAARLNPLATFRASGLDMIFGSDGMPPGPLYGMHCATTHINTAERLSVGDAIDGYTAVANRVGRHAREAGSIARGQLADLTVLDADPLAVGFSALRVTRTIVGGRLVYDASQRRGSP